MGWSSKYPDLPVPYIIYLEPPTSQGFAEKNQVTIDPPWFQISFRELGYTNSGELQGGESGAPVSIDRLGDQLRGGVDVKPATSAKYRKATKKKPGVGWVI